MYRRFLILMLLLTCLGCGSKKQNGASSGPKRVDTAQLPQVGEPITGLDEGRLTVSPPANWFVQTGAENSYLARFTLFKRGDSPLPVIVITVDDSPFAKLETVTEERLAEFGQSMAELTNQKGGKLLEEVRPMMLGEIPCVRYVKQARLKFRVPEPQTIVGERQVIQTLANGRLYTIDLRIRPDSITKYRDQAYAVVASMKFAAPKE